MPTITLEVPLAGTEIEAALHATNYADLQTLLNGGLDDQNLADAAITRAKLATVTRKQVLTVFGATVTPFATIVFPDAATNTLYVQAIIPDDYVSGNITWKIHLRALAGSGTAKVTRTISRFRDATAVATIDSAVAQDFVSASTNDVLVSGTVTSSNFQAGDVLRIDWQRLGSDGADTLAAGLVYDGGWIEYTGRS